MAGYSPGSVASLLNASEPGSSNPNLTALFSPSPSTKQVIVPKLKHSKSKEGKSKSTKLMKKKSMEQKPKKKKKKQQQESDTLHKREAALRQADDEEDTKLEVRKKKISQKKKKAQEDYQKQLAEEKAEANSVKNSNKSKLHSKTELKHNPEKVTSPKKSKKEKGLVHKNDVSPANTAKDSGTKKIKHSEAVLDNSVVKTDNVKKEKEAGKEGRKAQRERRKLKKGKDRCTIFVGNLPIAITKKALVKLFSEYGKVESVRLRCAAPGDPKLPKKAIVITKNFHKERHNINAYVVFEKPEEAKEAIKANRRVVDGMKIRVDMAKNSNKHDDNRSIFVGNLPFGAEEDALGEHFEDCGIIENVRIIRDARSGIGKGFGYVLFDSKDAVSFAVKLDGEKFNERPLRVQRAAKPTKDVDRKDQKQSADKRKKDQQEGPPAKKRKFTLPSNMSASSYQGVVATKFRVKKKKQKNIQKKKVKIAKLKESKKEKTNSVPTTGKGQGKPPKHKAFSRKNIANKKTTKGR